MQVNGNVHIVVGCKNGRSFLKHNYNTQPFKVADITEDRTGSLVNLVLMSSSPGILDNDDYKIEIEIQQNASLHLTTQAFQRLFNMKATAKQELNVALADNASLIFLPHPSVPQKASNYFSENNIKLGQNHNLLWSEIITCGRKLNGEVFSFTRYHNITNIFIEDKLVVKENILLEPANVDIQALGQMESYSHQSTLLWVNNKADIIAAIEICRTVLKNYEGITFGVSKLAVNGLIIRILGHHGEQLFQIAKDLEKQIEDSRKASLFISTETFL